MNNIHNNGENEPLKNDLSKLSEQYRRLEQDEPPELLDQAILNQAHRALEKRPYRLRFNWVHGLATAAVFVLAFSIIVDQRESVPVLEQGSGRSEPALLRLEDSAKKQLRHVEAEAVTTELKEKNESQDKPQNTPMVSSPASPAPATTDAARAGHSARENNISLYSEDSTGQAIKRFDKDALSSQLLQEELAADEIDITSAIPEEPAKNSISKAPALAEPVTNMYEADSEGVSTIEKELSTIIKLKQNGDEAWKTELKLFRENHPDYPLPDELNH